jgi:hypothetical protein
MPAKRRPRFERLPHLREEILQPLVTLEPHHRRLGPGDVRIIDREGSFGLNELFPPIAEGSR